MHLLRPNGTVETEAHGKQLVSPTVGHDADDDDDDDDNDARRARRRRRGWRWRFTTRSSCSQRSAYKFDTLWLQMKRFVIWNFNLTLAGQIPSWSDIAFHSLSLFHSLSISIKNARNPIGIAIAYVTYVICLISESLPIAKLLKLNYSIEHKPKM